MEGLNDLKKKKQKWIECGANATKFICIHLSHHHHHHHFHGSGATDT